MNANRLQWFMITHDPELFIDQWVEPPRNQVFDSTETTSFKKEPLIQALIPSIIGAYPL